MRILGITIPEKKHLEYALTTLHGVGLSRAQAVLDELKIDRKKKVADIDEAAETKIREKIESFVLEGDLRRSVAQNVKRLKDIESYRGGRHSRGLPSRGQRTKSNNRTLRGNKVATMGSGRVKVSKT